MEELIIDKLKRIFTESNSEEVKVIIGNIVCDGRISYKKKLKLANILVEKNVISKEDCFNLSLILPKTGSILNSIDFSVKGESSKQLYKSNKKAGIVSCPKCGSQSITTTNKKISIGKGVAGAAIGAMVNPVGTVVGGAVGATHSKKIYNVCMNCGHKWKP